MIERLLHFFERYPIDLLAHLSSCFPIIVAFFRLPTLEANLKYVWLLFIFFFFKDTYALVHMFLKPNILYLQNLEVIVETSIIGAIFFYSFDKIIYKRLILFLTIFCTVIAIFFYRSSDVSSVSLSIFRLFSIILSLAYFNKILKDMRIKYIGRYSMFWFTSGLLIYTTGTFFIMLFSEYWYKDINKVPADIFDKYWNISQILFIIFCITSAYGIWVSKFDRENTV